MEASAGLDAAWLSPATPRAVRDLRHRAVQFASAAGAPDEVVERIAFAVSETVTNAVIHAYGASEGQIRLKCAADGEELIFTVADEGVGIAPRPDSPGIGHGLTIVGALAQSLDISPGPDGRGTVVTMGFGPHQATSAPPGLETLCAVALETVADVSCLDVIRGGVLRRIAAEVAGEPVLTSWLRRAMPPAKPGTATWSALSEGGARLVVHDPTARRSPGGPGERLDLTWWVAVAVEAPNGDPAALWGFGGRSGGHPVPSERVIEIVAKAAHGDLARAADRAMLRAQLPTGRS